MHCPLQARLFDEPQLASLCLENIDKNTADAITAEGFTDIDLGKAGGVPGRGHLVSWGPTILMQGGHSPPAQAQVVFAFGLAGHRASARSTPLFSCW